MAFMSGSVRAPGAQVDRCHARRGSVTSPPRVRHLALSTNVVSFPRAMIEETMTYALLQAVKASRASISPALAANGLHSGPDLLLSALWAEEGITQAELVSRLDIKSPTGQQGPGPSRAGRLRPT
jgi:hypothetical protein